MKNLTIKQLKKAYESGAEIQTKLEWLTKPPEWGDIDNPIFGRPPSKYRVKPTEEKPV